MVEVGVVAKAPGVADESFHPAADIGGKTAAGVYRFIRGFETRESKAAGHGVRSRGDRNGIIVKLSLVRDTEVW